MVYGKGVLCNRAGQIFVAVGVVSTAGRVFVPVGAISVAGVLCGVLCSEDEQATAVNNIAVTNTANVLDAREPLGNFIYIVP